MGVVLGLMHLVTWRAGFVKLPSRIMREVCLQASFSKLCLSVGALAILLKDSCDEAQSQPYAGSG